MTAYDRGAVILVEIAFSGAPGRKRRPAVVISTDTFNNGGIKLIVAAITGNFALPLRPGDTILNDWQSAGLVKPSSVRARAARKGLSWSASQSVAAGGRDALRDHDH